MTLPGYWVDHSALAPRSPPSQPWLVEAMAIAEALFETPAGPPPRQHLYWLAEQLADYTAKIGPRSRFVLRASLKALALLTPVVALKPMPITRLPLGSRAEALTWLEHSPASLAMFAVKVSLCILWYEHPEHARDAGLHTLGARRPR